MKQFFSPLIVVILLVVIYFSTRLPDINTNQPDDRYVADFSFENVTISLLHKGKKRWVVTASQSQIFNFSSTIFLKDINGGFLSENDDATIFEFESPLGVFYFQTEVLDLVRTNAHFSVDDITTFVISDELMVNIADKTIAMFKLTPIK